ncbi:MAG: GNAT family N-acetyltransferase [Mycoplasmataceae bacterium]|jgi:ribosomal-protein-alanine N-acetyltransferase|nr:GNAT family N-acetyltransferase [Mycoplasmataceae bacterium]
MNIRIANIEDLSSIGKLEDENFPSYEHYSFEQLKEMMNNENYQVIVSVEDKKVIGYLIINKTGDDFDLQKICVDVKHRNKKMATNMFNFFINSHKNSRILIEVRESNSSALSFYTKLGFVKIITKKNYYPNEDAILMEKKVL